MKFACNLQGCENYFVWIEIVPLCFFNSYSGFEPSVCPTRPFPAISFVTRKKISFILSLFSLT